MIMDGLAGLDRREIERRKERIRRAWAYLPVDHLPLGFFREDFSRCSLQELCRDGLAQYEANRASIELLLRTLPDDYIPVARVWPGYITIATLFGLPIHWGEDPSQPPGVLEHPVTELARLRGLSLPDARRGGLMPFNLRWLAYFRDHFPPEVSLAGIDLGGPLNTARDLFETDLLFTAMYDAPEELEGFLRLAAEVQVRALREIAAAVGDIDRFSCLDFDPIWAPEGKKGFVSDDVCAGLSPECFRRFSRPFNNLILREWPGGRLHNCGPHPALELYLDHDPPLDGLNCSFRYTRAELPRLREAFAGRHTPGGVCAGRGIVELMFDNGESASEIVAGYEEAADRLCPEVAAIPVVWINESWPAEEIRALYEELRRVAARWAAGMRWKPER